jgi:hypothetical protein
MGALAAALLALAALVAPAPASAQRARPDREYQRLVRQAIREFDAGHWEEARALFQSAHDRFPSARTFRGIGMAAFEMRAYADAHRALTNALLATERPLTNRQRREVEELLERTHAFVGRFKLVVEPASANVTLDLEPLAPDDAGIVLLSVGDHVLAAEAEGYITSSQRLRVEGGDERTVRVVLEPVASTPVAAPSEDTASGDAFPWPLAFLGAGGAFGVTTILGIVWTVNRGDELGACDTPPAGQMCANRDTLTGQRDAALGFTIASSVLAVGLAGVGLYLLLFDSPNDADESPSGAMVVRCAPTALGVSCTGTF